MDCRTYWREETGYHKEINNRQTHTAIKTYWTNTREENFSPWEDSFYLRLVEKYGQQEEVTMKRAFWYDETHMDQQIAEVDTTEAHVVRFAKNSHFTAYFGDS